jgi:hypothetical protein
MAGSPDRPPLARLQGQFSLSLLHCMSPQVARSGIVRERNSIPVTEVLRTRYDRGEFVSLYLLTVPGELAIMPRAVPLHRRSNAIRSTSSSRLHHASRRRGGRPHAHLLDGRAFYRPRHVPRSHDDMIGCRSNTGQLNVVGRGGGRRSGCPLKWRMVWLARKRRRVNGGALRGVFKEVDGLWI